MDNFSLLNLKNLINIATHTLKDSSIVYYYKNLPDSLTSFKDSFVPSLWRNCYQSFACVIVNSSGDEVILVRDHLGTSPLYYCHYLGKELIVGETIPEILNTLPKTPPFLESQIEALFSDQEYLDETIYQGIYRVEPGHLMHFKANGTVIKKPFWQLERSGPLLHYSDDRDYLDHFSVLMKEALQNATQNQHNIAAEFSAGIDSSAVYCAAADINIRPKLYMNVHTPGTDAEKLYNNSIEKYFIQHYQLNDIERIGVEDFDPLAVFKNYAKWFAGPAPYLYFMFSYNLHRAMEKGKHPIVLSGFGGDQCVSGQIPFNFYLPDLIHQSQYRKAWQEFFRNRSKMKKILRSYQFLPYLHPNLYQLSLSLKKISWNVKNSFRNKNNQLKPSFHPYLLRYYKNVHEAEWFLLQGPDSHEVRMRIEYSSIVSKQMGFEYRYPLLYPKLLEFFLSLPITQKRRNGVGRYLLRQYVNQFLADPIFTHYKKQEGLGIVPATFDLYQQKFLQGCYQKEFSNLPYAHLIKCKQPHMEMRKCIKGYMLKQSMKNGINIGKEFHSSLEAQQGITTLF